MKPKPQPRRDDEQPTRVIFLKLRERKVELMRGAKRRHPKATRKSSEKRGWFL